MKIKKIAALTLTSSCLAFTLPSVAANNNHMQFKAPSAYQQKSDVNESIEQLKNEIDLRFARLNMILKHIFKEQLSVIWHDV